MIFLTDSSGNVFPFLGIGKVQTPLAFLRPRASLTTRSLTLNKLQIFSRDKLFEAMINTFLLWLSLGSGFFPSFCKSSHQNILFSNYHYYCLSSVHSRANSIPFDIFVRIMADASFKILLPY